MKLGGQIGTYRVIMGHLIFQGRSQMIRVSSINMNLVIEKRLNMTFLYHGYYIEV